MRALVVLMLVLVFAAQFTVAGETRRHDALAKAACAIDVKNDYVALDQRPDFDRCLRLIKVGEIVYHLEYFERGKKLIIGVRENGVRREARLKWDGTIEDAKLWRLDPLYVLFETPSPELTRFYMDLAKRLCRDLKLHCDGG